MINLVELRKIHTIEIWKNDDLWKNIDQISGDEEVFDAQGDKHEDLDIKLVEEIDEFLFPYLGDWEDGERWYHSLLCNGDGIRAISVNLADLSNEIISGLQRLLVSELCDFTIIINVHYDFYGAEDSDIGSIIIRNEKIYISKEVQKSILSGCA